MFTWGMQLIFWVKEMCSIRADWLDPVTISVPSTTSKYLYILSYPSPSAILSNYQDKMEHAYYRMRYLSHTCNMTYHNAEFKTNSSVEFSSVSKASFAKPKQHRPTVLMNGVYNAWHTAQSVIADTDIDHMPSHSPHHVTDIIMSVLLWHTQVTVFKLQLAGIQQCEWTLTTKLTLIFQALSHQYSNWTDRNIHWDVYSKRFLSFNRTSQLISPFVLSQMCLTTCN